MKKVKAGTLWKCVGIVYLALAALAYLNALRFKRVEDVFWLCYLAALLIGFGFVLKKDALVQSQLYLLFIPDIIWTADFFALLISGQSLLGTSDYFFRLQHWTERLVSVQHLLTVPLALVFFAMKPGKGNIALLISVVELAFVYALTRLFVAAEQNVNCVAQFCGTLQLPGAYEAWWFGGMILVIVLTHFFASLAHK